MLSTRQKYTTYKLIYKYYAYKTHKGPKLNTLEQFQIYRHHKTHTKNDILNDQITYDHILYNIIIQ